MEWNIFIKGILAGFVFCRECFDKCNSKIIRVRGFLIVIVMQELIRVEIYFS